MAAAVYGSLVRTVTPPPRPEPQDLLNQWMRRNPGRTYAAAIVLVATFALLIFAPMWLADYRLEHKGREMIATVREINPREHGGVITFEYAVGGLTYWATTGLGDDGRSIDEIHPGDPVRITYLPSDPEVARAGHRPRDTLGGVAGMAGSAALLAAVVWLIPLYLEPRRRLREASARAGTSAR